MSLSELYFTIGTVPATSPNPGSLRRGPFTVGDARRLGVHWDDLQTKRWTRLSRGQYAWTGLSQDTRLRLRAVADRMPDGYAFSGRTAAWLHGLDVDFDRPIEVTIDRQVPVRARAGVRLRRAALTPDEVAVLQGFPATSALRTVCDLGSGRDLVASVVAVDMALHSGLVTISQLATHVSDNQGAKGIKRLRRSARLADAGSESPMETRLRMALVASRLPRPLVQTELRDAAGAFIGRADLYYPDRRLVIEYDGNSHRDRLVSDLRRQNALVNAGYHVLRFTAADLQVHGWVTGQVRHARATIARHPVSPDEGG